MNKERLSAPLVGAFFRPPAAQLLSELPSGAILTIEREPDNQYDSEACRVVIYDLSLTYPEIFDHLVEQAVPDDEEKMKGQWYKRDVAFDPLHLGYVGAKTGHAAALTALMKERGVASIFAQLAFDLQGKPEVIFDCE